MKKRFQHTYETYIEQLITIKKALLMTYHSQKSHPKKPHKSCERKTITSEGKPINITEDFERPAELGVQCQPLQQHNF